MNARLCGLLAASLVAAAGAAASAATLGDDPAQIALPVGADPAGAAAADAAPAPARTLAAILIDLDSDEYAVREAATTELNRLPLSLSELEAAMADAALTHEQRERVGQIAKNRFCASPRAAMGVSFGQARNLEVTDVFANFPARGTLQASDIIVSVDGHDVSNLSSQQGYGLESIRPYIVCHDPGDVVKMGVIRRGKRVDLDVKLGSFASLPQQAGFRADIIQAVDLSAAWRVRSFRRHMNVLGPAVAVPSIPPPATKAAAEAFSALQSELQAQGRADDGEWAGITAGGIARATDTYLAGPGAEAMRAAMELNRLNAVIAARQLEIDDLKTSINEFRKKIQTSDPETAAKLTAERENRVIQLSRLQREMNMLQDRVRNVYDQMNRGGVRMQP